MKKELLVEFTGEENHLNDLAYFLRLIEYLGNVGATRTLKLWIDGDGATRIKVNFPNMKDKIEVNEDVLKEDIEVNIE